MTKKLFILLFYFFSSSAAHAAKTTIFADAQEMIKDKRTQTLSLKGKVNVIFQQQHLLCDEAVVYEATSTIIAQGHVILQTPRTTLRGDRIEFNYDTNTGKVFRGAVTSGQVLIEADEIKKVGEEQYEADDAYYTACTTCPASWGFTSSNIQAEIGGYAYISRPWLHLLQFPVLPLPYLVVPLNSKRRTGLLVPKPFSNRNGGFAIEQPFFWAIDRSHDATFSLINYEKRGLQATANYRYVISPTSSGELSGAFMRDRTVKNSEYSNRWFIEYGHHSELPNNYTQRTQLSLASDRMYSYDFFQQFLHNGQPALENSISLTKAFQTSLLSVEASYYLSQIEPNFDFRKDNSQQRLPEINYELNDTKISNTLNMFFSFEGQYLNIMRRGAPFEHARSGSDCQTYLKDPTTGAITTTPDPDPGNVCYPNSQSSGDFVYGAPLGQTPASNSAYGDLIRTGQRLDLKPRIHAPFWVGNVLDVDPSFMLRYTQYSLGVASDPSQGYDSFPSRFYGQLGVNVKSDLNRVYQWSKQTRIKHSIIPEVNLRYIPQIYQSNNNFFGHVEPLRYFRELQPIDDTDSDWRNGGRGIQFDNNDRVIGKQFINFSLTNKVIKRNLKNSSALNGGYERAFYFDVSQAFDIYELRRGPDARPWQSLNTDTAFQFGPFTQSMQTYYYPYHNRTTWRTSSRYTFLSNNFLQVGYTKNYNILNQPPVDENTRREYLYFSTGINLPYVYFFGSTTYDLNTSRAPNLKPFVNWTVAMQITPPGACWTINAQFVKQVNTPIQPSINMEFKFSD